MSDQNGFIRYNSQTSRWEVRADQPPEGQDWQPFNLTSCGPSIRNEILTKYPPAPERRHHRCRLPEDDFD